MNHSELQVRGLTDPQLSVHATSALPVWLWATDGTRILWANPVGARVFGAANSTGLARRTFGPADAHRRQIAQLAGRLPANGAIRHERLSGFGASLGSLMTCGCARLNFFDRNHFSSNGGILIVAHAARPTMPLTDRLQQLLEGVDAPIAAFTRDGMLVGTSDAARRLLGFSNLGEAGLEDARNEALKHGHAETSIGAGHMVLRRLGSGADVALVAVIVPNAASISPLGNTAAAGFELVDEFTEPSAKTANKRDSLYEDASRDAMTSDIDTQASESSSGREAGADEPAAPSTDETPSWPEEAPLEEHLHPLRFVWQIDAGGRLLICPGEFTHLIGSRTAASLGQPWSEFAESFALDPDGVLAKAIATEDAWSGVSVNWPADGGDRLPVELTGLPEFDRTRQFAGYRGFGVCRDLDGLSRLAASRRLELHRNSASRPSPPLSADIIQINSAQEFPVREMGAPDLAVQDLPAAKAELPSALPSELLARVAVSTSPATDLEGPVETPPNVVPFRPIGEAKSPGLTPVENTAFDELARQLSAHLDRNGTSVVPPAATVSQLEPPVLPPFPAATGAQGARDPLVDQQPASVQPASHQPEWLAPPEPPARGEPQRDRMLLDLLPTGILIYRLDRLLYANPAFLQRIGYASLHALEDAGGLDALYVEPGVSSASSTSEAGTPMTISASEETEQEAGRGKDRAGGSTATDARLFTISWDGDSALALICSPAAPTSATMMEAAPANSPPAVGRPEAEDLAAILDTTAEGVVMFDAEGKIHACNRSAEALFGYDGAELVARHLSALFAPESQRVVADYLHGITGAEVASLLDHGRDVLGRVREGGIIPLSMTMGRTRPGGANFFAVFRDLSQSKKCEGELQQTQRQADRAANAKADMLARISHEVRTPLNAIIGFAEVMVTERFGALGNERYVEYMKDIRSSGQRVIAIIDDLLELSRIETGKLDLSFANQNLNDLVESCVALMQPQANRERIIIRSSLAPALPPVIADARALRQITLNLIGNSIHLANAGGQVIVSTALSDLGEVVLRIRDTGPGLNDSELAAALEPFRGFPLSERASDGSPVNLSLTKALVEANRAQFQVKSGTRSGTLIEVVFSHALART